MFIKKPNFFFAFSILWGKAFCFRGGFLGLGVVTVLVLTVKNKLGEGLLFVGCPSPRKRFEQTKQLLGMPFYI